MAAAEDEAEAVPESGDLRVVEGERLDPKTGLVEGGGEELGRLERIHPVGTRVEFQFKFRNG